jgi:hypothetical protein
MIALALVCAALIGLVIYLLRHQNFERAEWSRERQLLITRIQHPEYVVATPDTPTRPNSDFFTSEPDDLDLVGAVVLDGNDD